MFSNLDIFQTAHAMARHAGQRQALVAENMANADTPGYRARDLMAFADTLREGDPTSQPRATRPGHLFGTSGEAAWRIVADTAGTAASGNAVSLETEMLRAVEIKRQHDRALAIYKSGLSVLRMALGRNG